MELKAYKNKSAETVWDSAPVRRLIQTLKSEAFRSRIEAMGGYTLDRPGEIIGL